MPTLDDIIKGANDLLAQTAKRQIFGKADNSTVRFAEKQRDDLIAQGAGRIADLKQRKADVAASYDRAIAAEHDALDRLKAQVAATTQPQSANAAALAIAPEPEKPVAGAKPKRTRTSTK